MTDRPMTLMEHLGELRKRLIIAFLSVAVAAVLGYARIDLLRDLLRRSADGLQLIYLTPPEVLMTDIKLSLMAGTMLASPIILYQVWGFVLPGLKRQERHMIVPLVFLSVILFFLGMTFSFLVVVPLVLTFFLGFSAPGLSAMFSYTRFVSFVTTLVLTFGLLFQMPLVLVFLSRAGFVTTMGLRRTRKFAYLLMLIGSAIFTPPDFISQLLMAGPLAILYEISILLSWLVTRGRKPAY